VAAIEFIVYGHPATAGSKRAFPIRRGGQFTGRVAVTDDSARTKSWQAQVATAAAEHDGAGCVRGPVRLAVAFYFHRPRNHYRSGRNAHLVRNGAPAWHQVRPDLLKLTRAIEDALTGVLWHDDAQVCEQQLSKHYAEADEPERVRVRVELLAPEPPVPGAHPRLLPGQLELEA
jgi:Holliday junction resolvase RusA-like endonuclease